MQGSLSVMHIASILFVLCCQLRYGRALNGGSNEKSRAASLTWTKELYTHAKNDDSGMRRYADMMVLGFVTPWNSNGIDVAIKQASRGRLEIVSPVTWQVHPSGLVGGHDFDEEFYKDVSKAGSRIYPRILFEKWTRSDFLELAKGPEPMVQRIIQLCEKNNFEGVVLEVWQSLLNVGALQGPDKVSFLELVRTLGEGIRQKGELHTVLVLPPYAGPHPKSGIVAKDFEDLKVAFNYFVIMTYDFSMPGSEPGPMAPIEWVEAVGKFFSKDCNLGRKVLLGLNFYGLDFLHRQEGEEPDDRHVLGHEYVELLQEHKPKLQWIEEIAEHAFAYKEGGQQRVVFFPTRFSVGRRIALVEEIGCGGVAIWELGQGLDHFFDEF